MHYDPGRHHRRSIRLKGYDYSQAGAYFVTICVADGQSLLGEVVDGVMRMSRFGEIVQTCWDDLPRHYPHVQLDAFVVMPNHVHGVIMLVDDDVPADSVGAGFKPAPKGNEDDAAPTGSAPAARMGCSGRRAATGPAATRRMGHGGRRAARAPIPTRLRRAPMQLTHLLFLKMAGEQSRPPLGRPAHGGQSDLNSVPLSAIMHTAGSRRDGVARDRPTSRGCRIGRPGRAPASCG